MTPLDEPDALNISAPGRGEDKFFSKKIFQSVHALSRRISFGYAAVVPAELAFFFSAASGEGNEFAAPALLPAGFLVAGLALGDVGLFPLGDGLGLVVAHLVIHAGAVFQDHRIGRAALVVLHARIDPFDVVGGGGEGGGGRYANGGERENGGNRLHGVAP